MTRAARSRGAPAVIATAAAFSLVLMSAPMLVLALASAPAPARAQAAASGSAASAAEPGTREIIDALTPRLRSLRNLGVRPRAPASAPATEAQVAADTPAGLSATTPTTTLTAPAVDATSSSAAPVPERASIALQIRFDFDSARIRPDSSAVLGRLAEALSSAELGNDRFLIEGHTDARGNAGYNQRLSQVRADAVLRFLVERGVRAERVSAQGRGSQEPANRQDPLAAENRRVRIVNLAP